MSSVQYSYLNRWGSAFKTVRLRLLLVSTEYLSRFKREFESRLRSMTAIWIVIHVSEVVSYRACGMVTSTLTTAKYGDKQTKQSTSIIHTVLYLLWASWIWLKMRHSLISPAIHSIPIPIKLVEHIFVTCKQLIVIILSVAIILYSATCSYACYTYIHSLNSKIHWCPPTWHEYTDYTKLIHSWMYISQFNDYYSSLTLVGTYCSNFN